MATTTLLKLITILSLLTITATAFSANLEDDNDDEEYILDSPFNHTRLRSRFLANIKKGTYCDRYTNNVCNGVSANKGKSLLYCCKTHCRNIMGDRNNCGQCGRKCGVGELCCNGSCMRVAYNDTHCGKCNNACSKGRNCHYGFCGYA